MDFETFIDSVYNKFLEKGVNEIDYREIGGYIKFFDTDLYDETILRLLVPHEFRHPDFTCVHFELDDDEHEIIDITDGADVDDILGRIEKYIDRYYSI